MDVCRFSVYRGQLHLLVENWSQQSPFLCAWNVINISGYLIVPKAWLKHIRLLEFSVLQSSVDKKTNQLRCATPCSTIGMRYVVALESVVGFCQVHWNIDILAVAN